MTKRRIKEFDIKIENDFENNLKVTYLCPETTDHFIINDAIYNRNSF